jgi:peroxiredoxin
MRLVSPKKPVNGSKPWGLVVIGIGLVLLGVSAGFLWLPSVNSVQGQAPAEESVIPVEVNFEAPRLALQDLTGQESSLEDYEGQVVLVNNWATWCPPCKEEMPALQEYYNRHKKHGFTLIAVEAGEPLDEVAQFVDDYDLSFIVWLDPESKALRAFNNYSLPSSYVIDRTGIVRMAWTGSISLQMLEKYITPLVEE